MKYENFKQVKGLVEQIDKHKDNLSLLGEVCTVTIKRDYGPVIYNIGAYSDGEHEYKNKAIELIDCIKSDLEARIEMLKGMLELL